LIKIDNNIVEIKLFEYQLNSFLEQFIDKEGPTFFLRSIKVDDNLVELGFFICLLMVCAYVNNWLLSCKSFEKEVLSLR
jgi:hypothetical protein